MQESQSEGGILREHKVVVWTTEYRGRIFEYIETRSGCRIPLPDYIKPILERERRREQNAKPIRGVRLDKVNSNGKHNSNGSHA
jgi:hypothetical protein